jgi:hypothetical protein
VVLPVWKTKKKSLIFPVQEKELWKSQQLRTGYGRTTSTGVGFQGSGSASKPEEYAAQLLELYGKCRAAVEGKK